MRRLFSVVLWSVIAGAFIGPGTVTTAASAGARFGLSLTWALLFSTVACIVLQEASARVTVASGRELGEILSLEAGGGLRRVVLVGLIVGAIVIGCAAYQAGNVLGGVAGGMLLTGLPGWMLTLVVGGMAGIVLWLGTPRLIAGLLGLMVAGMGVAFLVTAAALAPSLGELIDGALVPRLPPGSGILALGLIGTTVVPYNLFLGSGLARGENLRQVRFGLPVAVLVGGFISAGILVVGSAVAGEFSFEALSEVLRNRLGAWAEVLFGMGLFAAGLSSATTAPWAAAMTARSLFQDHSGRWETRSMRYRAVWIGVLLTGVGFGLAGVKPIPAIIAAQVLNGILLPVVATLLLIAANNRKLLGEAGVSSPAHAVVMAATVGITMLLGVTGIGRAVASVAGASPDEQVLLGVAAAAVAVVAVPVFRAVRRARAVVAGDGE